MVSLLLFPALFSSLTDSLTSWCAQQPFPVVASIRRVENQQEIFQYRGDQWISPASTWKILAVATAKQQLGAAFRFKTTVTHTGAIHDQDLWGDLVVEASGDPTFGSKQFPGLPDPIPKLVNTLKSLGIRRIEGQIRLKRPISRPQIPNTWLWGDMGNYYGAFPQAFNYLENQFSVYFTAGKSVGEPASIASIQPLDSTWTILNQVTTGPAQSGDQVIIYSAPGSTVVYLTGTVPLGTKKFEVKGSLHSPWSVFQQTLTRALHTAGIVWQPAEVSNHSPERPLITFESPSLQTMATRCLAESVNLYADALLYRAAGMDPGVPWDQVKTKILGQWTSFPTPFWEDGSGLSPLNLVQASTYSQFLASLPSQLQQPDWPQWLPQLGKDGTVRTFQPAERPIFVKSGSIQQTRTYAGYIKGQDGQWYVFFVGAHPLKTEQRAEARRFFQTFFKKLPQWI